MPLTLILVCRLCDTFPLPMSDRLFALLVVTSGRQTFLTLRWSSFFFHGLYFCEFFKEDFPI